MNKDASSLINSGDFLKKRDFFIEQEQKKEPEKKLNKLDKYLDFIGKVSTIFNFISALIKLFPE